MTRMVLADGDQLAFCTRSPPGRLTRIRRWRWPRKVSVPGRLPRPAGGRERAGDKRLPWPVLPGAGCAARTERCDREPASPCDTRWPGGGEPGSYPGRSRR